MGVAHRLRGEPGDALEVDTRDAILMLEDVTELPYRVDRMLQQLKAAGKLDRVVGVALGSFTDCDDERAPEDCRTACEEVFGPLGVPVVAGTALRARRRESAVALRRPGPSTAREASSNSGRHFAVASATNGGWHA